MNLKYQTILGLLWNGVELVGGQFVQLLITLILARLLSPEEFGIIGLLIIFLALSKVIIESGFSQALIRAKSTTEQDYSSVFYLNISLGVILYIVLYLVSPLIADFYDYPELTEIARVVFLAIPINSFGVVPNAKITRDLDFKVLAKRSIIANFLAGIIAVILAYYNFGVWALVFHAVLSALFRVILLWIFSKWIPAGSFNPVAIKKMFKFSSNILISGVFDVFVTNIHTLLIGKYYTKAELGFYTQAKRLEDIPASTLTSMFRNVSFPVLSKFNDSPVDLKNAFKKVIKMATYIVSPLMIGLMLVADEVILIILGRQWVPAAQFLKPLCLLGAMMPLYSINLNLYLIRGKSNLYLRLNIVKRIITLTAILITINYSVLALVYGQVIAYTLNTILTMIFTGKEIDYSFIEQLRDLWRGSFATLLMTVSVYLLGGIVSDYLYLKLFLQVLLGVLTYIGLSYVFKIDSFFEIIKMAQGYFSRNTIK